MLFKKKSEKTVSKSGKTQSNKSVAKSGKSGKVQSTKPAVKNGKSQSVKPAVKGGKVQSGKPADQNGKTQDKSDEVLAKLMEIEKETRLKQVRDNVDQLESEKIAENIELLLKIMRSGE